MAITAQEKAAILAEVVGARSQENLGALIDGLNTAVEIAAEAANVAAVGTLTAAAGDADHTNVVADLATLKTAINAILTSLKNAGLMADA